MESATGTSAAARKGPLVGLKVIEMVVETDHGALGPVKCLGLPVKFSRTPGAIDRPAPQLGEHTRQVLREYGYNGDQIESLISSGSVIADGARAAVK